MSDDITNKLSRWSRRKLAARQGAAVEDVARAEETPATAPVEQAPADSAPATTAATPAPAEDASIPDLPPIEGLTFESDYTAFLAKNVPEALKHAALRKLWVSDPVLANLDGLNDYCENLNLVDTSITLAQTSYQPGSGYFDDAKEKLKQELLKTGESATDAPPKTESENDSVSSDASGDEQPDAPRPVAAGESPEDSGTN